MLRIAIIAVVIFVTSHLMIDAVANDGGDVAVSNAAMIEPTVATRRATAPMTATRKIDIAVLRDNYAACLKQHVKRYNDGMREAALVAEMTTHACAEQLHEIRWTLLSAGVREGDVTAYAARLQVRAREKLAEMVEYGF